MAQANGARAPIVAINVTPLVDVVLVLLVVLMVTAGYVVSRTIPVDLPRAESGESTSTTMAITLDRKGNLFIDGEPATLDELRQRSSELSRRSKNARALIAADGRTEHKSVVGVVDALRTSGITRFALNVDPEALEKNKP